MGVRQKFTPDQFVSGRHWTSERKAKIANLFVKFMLSGGDLYKDLYAGLSNMWGHVAHYDRHGFYEEWFSSPDSVSRFLRHPDSYWMSGQGDPRHTLSDVESALQEWIHTTGLIEKYDGIDW